MDLFDIVAGAIKVGSQIKQTTQELNYTTCPHCGYQLPKAAMFCSRCGKKTVVVQKEVPGNALNQAQQQPPQPVQNQQRILPQVFQCAGCRAPLPVNKTSEYFVCAYCDLRNVNPYYEAMEYIPKPRVETEPAGCVKCMYESTNFIYRNLTVSVAQTGDKIVLSSGQSGFIQLKKGLYKLAFNFGERKYYERTVRIYSGHTSISISCVSAKTRNVINISYTDGVLLAKHMLEFGKYKPDDYIQKLYALGFINIDKRSKSRAETLFNFGHISDVLVEEISIREGMYQPERFSEVGEVVLQDGQVTALRIPQEARITVIS